MRFKSKLVCWRCKKWPADTAPGFFSTQHKLCGECYLTLYFDCDPEWVHPRADWRFRTLDRNRIVRRLQLKEAPVRRRWLLFKADGSRILLRPGLKLRNR